MTKIPTDNHIRSMPDPVPASLLQPAFDQAIANFALSIFGRQWKPVRFLSRIPHHPYRRME